jgi:hypothetical protein
MQCNVLLHDSIHHKIHFVRDAHHSGLVSINYVLIHEMLVDIFTKPVNNLEFEKLVPMCRLLE